MKPLRRTLAGLFAGLAVTLGVWSEGRGSRVSRWRVALWALSVALIAGMAGGVRLAEAETVSPPDAGVAGLDAGEGDLSQVEPDMMVSCYCTAAPPNQW